MIQIKSRKFSRLLRKHIYNLRTEFLGTEIVDNRNAELTNSDIEKGIITYIEKNDMFFLSDLIRDAIPNIEPYKVRDVAHRVLNPMVANNKLKMKWHTEYYYEKIESNT